MLSISGNAIAQLVAGSGGTVYTPAQIRTAYGINNLSLDGTGQTIAIVDAYDDPQIYQALDTFDGQFGLTTSGPTLYQQYGAATSFLTVLNQNGQATQGQRQTLRSLGKIGGVALARDILYIIVCVSCFGTETEDERWRVSCGWM